MQYGNIKNERGVSLVLLALAIVVIFGFAAIAIDVGHLYNVKNELQVAADAAALAGASKLVGSGTVQTNARNEAIKIAAANFADISYSPAITTAPVGEPIPVTLLPNTGNAPGGDIVVGYWSGTEFTPAPPGGFGAGSGMSINAVKAVARRTGNPAAGGTQPNVQNWFAKVFSLLPGDPDFSLANVESVAIAARTGIPILPIAVNEYWDEGAWDGTEYPVGDPFGQRYPQSFMRQTNVDGTPGLAPNIFPIIGTLANSNNTSGDLNSFVDIFFRNPYHVPLKSQWVEARQAAGSGVCTTACRQDNFDDRPDGVTVGDVNQGKWNEGRDFGFLFNGLPGDVIPPNAVREFYRNPETYFTSNYNSNSPNRNDPSDCPYATVAYYQSSGAGILNKKFSTEDDPSGKGTRFYEKYPKGSRFLVMVYDGTHEATIDPEPPDDVTRGQARAVTIVGYGIIEIDGYINGPINSESKLGELKPGGPKQGAGTAYGHAVPHGMTGTIAGVADFTDPYIIQPPLDPEDAHDGSCEFTDLIREVAENFGTVRLVDPGLKYGVHTAP